MSALPSRAPRNANAISGKAAAPAHPAKPAKAANTVKEAKAVKAVKTMSIGVVLEKLHVEFPEVTVSKIRFLEAEGLITPQRTSSGYRRFTQADVDRLHFILKTQRDDYLPLKVIREQLDAMDSGAVTPLRRGDAATLVSPEAFKAPVATRLTDSDVAEQSGVDQKLVATLISSGVIVPDSSGFFTNDDVAIVSAAEKLSAFGFDARHLRQLRNTASRQADLIERAAIPTARSGKNGRELADEMTQEMMALVVSMHANMVKSVLRQGRN